MPADETPTQRVDQWLWFSRIVKSRTLAQELIERGKVRLNRQRLEKTSIAVKPGDVLTITVARRIRVLEIAAIGSRRGPASEASLLYKDLSEPVDGAPVEERSTRSATVHGVRDAGAGRPTKRDRREFDRLRRRDSS